jgi:prepilin-type N-terminal cleavage/methylation domain-containing protein
MAHPRRKLNAFTLIELMAATTVLSVILLMMVGMQDQMSKAWSNSNLRTDATREARAAVNLISSDISSLILQGNQFPDQRMQLPSCLSNKGMPFLYSSNGSGLEFNIPNQKAGSSCLFFAATQPTRGTNYSDLALVGYYVAATARTNINGFLTTNFNLHRYYRPASISYPNLINWFAQTNITSLITGVDPERDEVLARNVANVSFLFYNSDENPVKVGANFTNRSSGTVYQGNKIQISLTIYPTDVAQKFLGTNSWSEVENIQKFARAFEFRIDCPRN